MSADELPVREVLIVGGGIAGLATAIALGRRGVHTTVVERGTGSVGASIGLKERSLYALDELGILEQVMKRGQTIWKTEKPNGIYESDGQQLAEPTPEHDDDWALPIEIGIYRPFLSEVMRHAATEQGAEVLFGHSYRSLDVTDDRVVAELTTGQRREFDLLVAADGVHSDLRTRFFPAAGEPVYIGSMSFRMMFENAPPDWRAGRHVAAGMTISSRRLPDDLFYLAIPYRMERRHVNQDEAREIVLRVLDSYRPSKMFDELAERVNEELYVIVAPYEWIFVEPPWHERHVVMIGDVVHATAPTMGAAGGMALEDAVVLAQELAKHDDLGRGLAAYAVRRRDRTQLVVETSATLMYTHQQHRPPAEETAMRTAALQQLVAPY